ncbi:MAG: UDP-2,3-diacylglucosamine diphosphatase [Proteobacteria bacterium]|uniref:UDP-2,3-diacylglucosamine diphosphatase n=1 Tax=Aquabacterium sp. TaxID=1872578 RepID=UPI0035C6ADEE|nr:UDP-2,3-diacylglucosamine diphosphatase [Pseudomonadota bacterium]
MHVAASGSPGPTGKPAFPGAPTLTAPPSWRCIDFISDIHLHEGLPRTTAALADYLSQTPADALFILGDLFEAWVGDDMRAEPREAECLRMLRDAARHRPVFIMVGNRDFLLSSDFLADCGATALHDPSVLEAFGQRALLMHGDELCLADTDYLRFRAQVRQPAWQQAFLAQPLAARLAQARQMREASQAHQQTQHARHEGTRYADVDEACARDWLLAAQADVLIHGHTHQPATEPFAGAVRHVLSDWHLDQNLEHPHGAPRAEALRWQALGFSRVNLA